MTVGKKKTQVRIINHDFNSTIWDCALGVREENLQVIDKGQHEALNVFFPRGFFFLSGGSAFGIYHKNKLSMYLKEYK